MISLVHKPEGSLHRQNSCADRRPFASFKSKAMNMASSTQRLLTISATDNKNNNQLAHTKSRQTLHYAYSIGLHKNEYSKWISHGKRYDCTMITVVICHIWMLVILNLVLFIWYEDSVTQPVINILFILLGMLLCYLILRFMALCLRRR